MGVPLNWPKGLSGIISQSLNFCYFERTKYCHSKGALWRGESVSRSKEGNRYRKNRQTNLASGIVSLTEIGSITHKKVVNGVKWNNFHYYSNFFWHFIETLLNEQKLKKQNARIQSAKFFTHRYALSRNFWRWAVAACPYNELCRSPYLPMKMMVLRCCGFSCWSFGSDWSTTTIIAILHLCIGLLCTSRTQRCYSYK